MLMLRNAKFNGGQQQCFVKLSLWLKLGNDQTGRQIWKRPDRTTNEETTRQDESLNFAKSGS